MGSIVNRDKDTSGATPCGDRRERCAPKPLQQWGPSSSSTPHSHSGEGESSGRLRRPVCLDPSSSSQAIWAWPPPGTQTQLVPSSCCRPGGIGRGAVGTPLPGSFRRQYPLSTPLPQHPQAAPRLRPVPPLGSPRSVPSTPPCHTAARSALHQSLACSGEGKGVKNTIPPC